MVPDAISNAEINAVGSRAGEQSLNLELFNIISKYAVDWIQMGP